MDEVQRELMWWVLGMYAKWVVLPVAVIFALMWLRSRAKP
jgi:hypothetical protein